MFAKAFCLLALCSMAYAVPKINDDFEAEVELFEQHGDHHVRIEGKVFSSYSTHKERIDANAGHEKPGHYEFLRLFNEKVEYEIRDNSTCRHHQFNATDKPAFGWCDDSGECKKAPHPCHAQGKNGKVGVLYMRDGHFKDIEIVASLCVDQAETEPYWTDIAVKGKQEQRLIHFQNFKPGNPAASVFDVPKSCK